MKCFFLFFSQDSLCPTFEKKKKTRVNACDVFTCKPLSIFNTSWIHMSFYVGLFVSNLITGNKKKHIQFSWQVLFHLIYILLKVSNDLPRLFFFFNTTRIGCWKFIRPESPEYPLKLVLELMLPGEIWRGTWCEIGFQIWVIDHIIACLLVFPEKQTKLEIVRRVAELWNVLLEPFN